MKLPQIIAGTDQVSMLNAFRGVNRNLRIQDGEFSDLSNITNDYFPVIGNRKKRGYIQSMTNPQALLGGKSLAWVDDDKLYYDEECVCELEKSGKERMLVMSGARLCVFPDGIMYNTYDKTTEHMGVKNVTVSPPALTLCKLDGTAFDDSNTVTSDTEPSDKDKYWIDTSSDPVVIKMYSKNTSMWVSLTTTYVKIEAAGIGKGLSAYDAATLSGIDKDREEVYNNWDFNTNNIIYDCGDDYVVVAGLINRVFTNSTNVTVERTIPELDYVCEMDNRIWGCSSGKHEIYASKQGDPKNWNFFGGLDSDSYAATVGTEDVFTGCVAYLGSVYFFKENGYHKLYGSKPSNYEMVWKPGRGVQKGSEKSIAIVEDYLCFKARDAVCIFSGTADSISEALGTEPYFDAVGGAYRNKYYICMRDNDYNFRLYVYDMTKGLWTIEDNVRYRYMANASNGFYIINENDDMWVVNNEKIYTKWFPSDEVYPGDDLYPGDILSGNLEGAVEWSMTTGDIGLDSPYAKYIKRLDIRLSIDIHAAMAIEVEYDSSGDWNKVMEYFCTSKRSYTLPIPVSRCDHLKLRISGHGDIRIYSIAIVREDGGDGRF